MQRSARLQLLSRSLDLRDVALAVNDELHVAVACFTAGWGGHWGGALVLVLLEQGRIERAVFVVQPRNDFQIGDQGAQLGG